MSEPKAASANNLLTTSVKTDAPRYERNQQAMRLLLEALRAEEDAIRQGGGAKAIAAQHAK